MYTPCENCGPAWRPTVKVRKLTIMNSNGINQVFNCEKYQVYKCQACGHISMDDDFKKRVNNLVGKGMITTVVTYGKN